ncbi:MAG: YraN family protein, partial [Planctomycetota bacterium]
MMSRSLTRWLRRMRTSYLDWRFGTIDLSASLGKRGEQAAVRLLRQSGYRIVGTSVSDRGG